MHRICVQTTARRIDVRELGKETKIGVLEEVLHRKDIGGLAILFDPNEEFGIIVECTVRAIVFTPAYALAINNLEDTGDVDLGGERGVVGAVTSWCTSETAKTIRIGWLKIISHE